MTAISIPASGPAEARGGVSADRSPPARIAVLSSFYAPEVAGIGPYTAELAEALAAKGHDVRVVSAFPFYPEWRARVPQGTLLYRTERRDGVRVTRCRVYVPRNPRAGRRLAHEMSWMFAAAPLLARLAWWADVWFVVTPSFGSAVLGAMLARAFGARVHLHVQDVVPDVALESGHLRPGIGNWLARALAGWTYRSFGSVSVLGDSMAARLARYRDVGRGRAVIAPNWVRDRAPTHATLPERLAGRPYAVYAGSFGRKQDLAMLVEAADLLSARDGPAIAVLGDGPGRDVVERAGSRLVWLGLVDDATYGAVLHHALAGIVALAPGVGDSVVPSKLAGYLGAGRPVVVAADAESEAARVVARARCGVTVPPGRPDLLADALCRLGADRAAREAFGAAGLAYADARWRKDAIGARIEKVLLALRARRRT